MYLRRLDLTVLRLVYNSFQGLEQRANSYTRVMNSITNYAERS